MFRDFGEILSEVESKIAAACARSSRSRDEVQIVAVTKTHGPEVVEEAWRAGLGVVGENKVQEAAWKKESSLSGPQWHLIGHLQSNKVRQALEIFDYIHSVDSVKLADRINFIADEIGVSPRILIEVNVSGEGSKNGMKPECVMAAVKHIVEECPRITLEGFMTMAPFSDNPEDSRIHFKNLRLLRDAIEKELNLSLPVLSMGMSGDYEVAIEEGATLLRLGTVLFGDRPKVKTVRAVADDDCACAGLDSYCGAGPTVRVLD